MRHFYWLANSLTNRTGRRATSCFTWTIISWAAPTPKAGKYSWFNHANYNYYSRGRWTVSALSRYRVSHNPISCTICLTRWSMTKPRERISVFRVPFALNMRRPHSTSSFGGCGFFTAFFLLLLYHILLGITLTHCPTLKIPALSRAGWFYRDNLLHLGFE